MDNRPIPDKGYLEQLGHAETRKTMTAHIRKLEAEMGDSGTSPWGRRIVGPKKAGKKLSEALDRLEKELGETNIWNNSKIKRGKK